VSHVSIVLGLDEADRVYATDPGDPYPAVHLGQLSVQLSGLLDPAAQAAVADRVLAAVTVWHTEMQRRRAEAAELAERAPRPVGDLPHEDPR
jgi:hypothetical protein